ncbi:MAG: sugar ABC transporter ATP-binding protein [Alkaliphilus sp.]|nr:MAG: sugar ABC transporter ATP-binding protein [Alkaliphilus sp.]
MKIRFENASMHFGDVKAVDELSFEVKQGEFAALLGPSGCGKTTTLFMLAGFHKPVNGNIYFNDKLVNKLEPEEREIGMVFQNYALYPHMTVMKNITFPLRMAKVNKEEAKERAIEIAKLVKIDDLMDRKPGQLSGGQQQRVAIARALVKKPKLLLLDEPLSNLDAKLRLETRGEIRRIQQEVGITTVFVTHDQEEAMSISDKIILMNKGRLQQHTTPQNMYMNPVSEFVASFMGNPPTNMLDLEWNTEKKRVQILGTDFAINTNAIYTEIIEKNEFAKLSIRPESINLVENGKSSIDAEIISIETIGRDTLLKVKCAGKEIRLLTEFSDTLKKGKIIKIKFDEDKINIFDTKTGMNFDKTKPFDKGM